MFHVNAGITVTSVALLVIVNKVKLSGAWFGIVSSSSFEHDVSTNTKKSVVAKICFIVFIII